VSRRRDPNPPEIFPGSKRLRIVCTGRRQHPLKGYYTLDAIPVDGTWLFVKRWSDGDDTEPPGLQGPQWSSVKLDVKCRQCGRHVPLTPETIQRLGLLVIDDDTPTLDVSLLS
jgi:hypothetical protein